MNLVLYCTIPSTIYPKNPPVLEIQLHGKFHRTSDLHQRTVQPAEALMDRMGTLTLLLASRFRSFASQLRSSRNQQDRLKPTFWEPSEAFQRT